MFPFKIHILADENIPIAIIKTLSEKGFNIKRVKSGLNDNQVFELSKLEKRVLLTFDRHFLNRLKFPPRESSGIIFIKIDPPLIDSISYALDKLLNTVPQSDFKGRLFILSISSFKVWP